MGTARAPAKSPLPLLREQVGVRGAPNKIVMRIRRYPRPLRTVFALHLIANQDKVNVYHRWDAAAPRDDVVVIANFAHRGLQPHLGEGRLRRFE